MQPQNQGQWLRGETLSFATSSKLKFKTDYLSKGRSFDAAEIAEFMLQFTGTVGGLTGTALGIDAPKLFSRVFIRDKDTRVDASGAVIFAANDVEFGGVNRADLPATVASGSTNSSYEYNLSVPFEFAQYARRTNDYRIPLPYILEGGSIQCNLAAAVPTGWNTAQSDWTVTLWTRVVENRVRELKSNLVYEQFNHTRSEDYFPIHGSARGIIATTDLTTTDYTSLSTYTVINSRTLDYESDFDPRVYRRRYVRQGKIGVSASGNNLVIDQKAWPILFADYDQRIGAMPDIDQLDIRLGAAPVANAALLAEKLISRNMTLAAMWMGYNSPAELAAAIQQYGFVVDEKNTPVGQYDPVLVTRMPIRLRPSRAH